MLRWISSSLLLLAASCATTPGPLADNAPRRRWRELTSEHFVVKTDLSSDAARKLVAQLEFSRAGLVQVLLDGHDDRRTRLHVIAFATEREFEPFKPTENTIAFFDHREGERIVLGPLADHRQPFDVSHELAHYLLYPRIPLQPSWFGEGIAELAASGSRPSARSDYVTHLPFPWNLREVRRTRVPVRALLVWRLRDPHRPGYQQWSWLLMDFLTNRYPEALRKFEARLTRFEDPTEAWNAAFPQWSLGPAGRTEVLDHELDAYKRQPDHRPLVFHVSPPAQVFERELSPAEAISAPLRLERAWAKGELASEVDRALAADPTNVEALRLKARQDPAAAERLGQRAVEAHPRDPAAWVLRAEAHGDRRDDLQRREADFRKAVELAPGDPDVALDFVAFLLDARHPQPALPLVLEAQRTAPWQPNAFFLGALAHAVLGQCDEADQDAVRYARLMAVGSKQSLPDEEQLLTRWLGACRRAR